MISQGTDGLSQGDMLAGVMVGANMLTFNPLALTAFERYPELMEWVDSWWGKGNNSWLTPRDGMQVQAGLECMCGDPHPLRPMQP
jgi:hypothetical protein